MEELRREALEACVKYHPEDLCASWVEAADRVALVACILDPYYCCASPCDLEEDLWLGALEEVADP